MGRITWTAPRSLVSAVLASLVALWSVPGLAWAVELEILGDMTSPHGGFGAYQNLILRSEQIDDTTSWTRGGTMTVTADDTTTAPDSSVTADKFAFTGAGVDSLTQSTSGVTAANGNVFTFSVWLRTSSGTGSVIVRIEDSTATPEGTQATAALTTTWERFSVSHTSTATVTAPMKAILKEAAAGDNLTILAWGAQLEKGTSKPGVYTRTIDDKTAASARDVGFALGKNMHVTGNIEVHGSLITHAGGGTPGDLTSDGNILWKSGTANIMTFDHAATAARTITFPDATTTVVGTDATQTLSGKTLTTPKFADLGFIADANGNELLILDTVASAVNELTLANAATGAGPAVTASGGDTNIDINLVPKGTGLVQIGVGGTDGSLKLYSEQGATDYTVVFTPHAAMTQNVTYTLPADDGTVGQVLQSDGAGALTWASAAVDTNANTICAGTTTYLDGEGTCDDISAVYANEGANSDITALSGLTGAISKPTSITLATGGGVRTDTTATNTLLLQAYDTDGAAYTTFATLTAATAPTMDLATSVTRGGLNIADVSSAQGLTNKTLGAGTVLSAGNITGNITADATITIDGVDIGAHAAASSGVHGATGTIVGTTDTQTLSAKTLTAPKFADLGFIADANGNELIILDTVASAVNEITLANAATGGSPTITASGGDANVSITFAPKGTGAVLVNSNLSVRANDKMIMDSADSGGTADDTYMVHDNANDRIRLYVDGVEVARFKK